MSKIDLDQDDQDKANFLRQLVERGRIDGAALGITKQVLGQGENSLSSAQAHVFKRDVLDVFVTAECKRCGGNIPWSEQSFAEINGGYCANCGDN